MMVDSELSENSNFSKYTISTKSCNGSKRFGDSLRYADSKPNGQEIVMAY